MTAINSITVITVKLFIITTNNNSNELRNRNCTKMIMISMMTHDSIKMSMGCTLDKKSGLKEINLGEQLTVMIHIVNWK